MIVEFDNVSLVCMIRFFWLYGGCGIRVWHRTRMEDREDRGICASEPRRPRGMWMGPDSCAPLFSHALLLFLRHNRGWERL